jgi:hypothetical protein
MGGGKVVKMRFGTWRGVSRGLEDPGGGFGEGIDGTDGTIGEMESMTHVNRSSAVSHPAGYSGPGTSGTLYPFSGISYEKIVQKKDPGKCWQCAGSAGFFMSQTPGLSRQKSSILSGELDNGTMKRT